MKHSYPPDSTWNDPCSLLIDARVVGYGASAWIVQILLGLLLAASCTAYGQALDQMCPRPSAGVTVTNPPELRSYNGILEVSLHLKYQQTLVSQGPPRYRYLTDDGLESPTLRVYPGDLLIIHLHNDLPPLAANATGKQEMKSMANPGDCAGSSMDLSTTNLHFHGMTVPPTCHQDEVIHTAVQAGQEFEYRVRIPLDEPPGLYWYHPHPHGFSERQVQGGASGAIVVEGIENAVSSVASLHQRILVLRDQQRIGPEAPGPFVPSWDISVNYVPVTYPDYQPATIKIGAGERELWRVVNAAADTIFNLQVLMNQVAQPVEMVAIDGVPLGTAKSIAPGSQTSILLPPGARAEFVVTAPRQGETAQLITQAWNTGASGDNDPKRTIANILPSADSRQEEQKPVVRPQVPKARRAKLPANTTPAVHRQLYFSQRSSNSQDPDNFVLYFITVAGQTPAAYRMGSPPNIVVHQGDIEDWTIENRSLEDHVFHIHQLHFKVLVVNGKPVNDPAMRDTVDVPAWSGNGPYPSVTVGMDFGDPNIVGTFLYHCHILKHEDMGMMGSVQVLAPSLATTEKGGR